MIAREVTTRSLLVLLHPLGWLNPGPKATASTKRTRTVPVLIVPELSWNRSTTIFIRIFLQQRGWNWVWAINSGSGSLAERATIIDKKIEQLIRASGAPQVDVVGHGLGGLPAAWAIRHRSGKPLVRRLVTFGTPWQGTRLAVFRPKRAASELLPGSPSLDDLQDIPSHTVAIWSPDDPTIVPSVSACPDWAETVCLEGAGHMEMVLSPRTFRAVQAALTHPVGGSSG